MNKIERMERDIESTAKDVAGTKLAVTLKAIQVKINAELRPMVLQLLAGKAEITPVLKLFQILREEINAVVMSL